MAEDPEAEEVRALADELQMQATAGWERRRNWLALLLQEKGAPLMRGEIDNDRQRHQQEGWCQAIEYILNRDQQVEAAWQEIQAQNSDQDREGEMTGGDFGVHYEAAQ